MLQIETGFTSAGPVAEYEYSLCRCEPDDWDDGDDGDDGREE